MGVREIAKFANQKAKPPATARTNTFLQITFDRVILFFSFFKPNLFLILHTLYEKPQTKRNFRNKTNHQTWVRNYYVAWQKETLTNIYQKAKAISDQQYAQDFRKKARLENQITERKEPDAIGYLGDRRPILVQIDEQNRLRLQLIWLEYFQIISSAQKQQAGK
jgi:hypothetical protein